MDESAWAIGRRVRYWRERRNLDRKTLADMVGRSVSWLEKIESGERRLLRLPMLERVAEVLGVDPSALTDAPVVRRTADCVDTVEVQAIRTALGRLPVTCSRGREPAARQPRRRHPPTGLRRPRLVVITLHRRGPPPAEAPRRRASLDAHGPRLTRWPPIGR